MKDSVNNMQYLSYILLLYTVYSVTCLLPSLAKLQLNWAELALIPLSPTIHPTSNHPIKFILQLICISVMCSFTLVLNGSNCKAQTRFSSNWAELALVSIKLTTHPPKTELTVICLHLLLLPSSAPANVPAILSQV